MKTYGLIGNPLQHSFSQRYFTEKFKKDDIDAEYLNFELEDIGQLMELFAEFPDLSGLNVTIPYKQLIIPYMDELSGEAHRTGAVNVVKIERNGGKDFRLIGHNTDYRAFKQTLCQINPSPRKALILGTGGASKAVAAALEDLDIEFRKVSRTPDENQLGYDALEAVINDYSLIVNTTPCGTFPKTDECPDLPYHELGSGHICYDLTYNPSVTEFMRKSAERGNYVKNGLEMLILQAEYSWEIWNS